ncbi:MAG: SpoIIIAH-like family protein [Clostridiales bacterium]|nr:SpoIIIAH-like family protein [Clostridiales bacterium]
MEFLKANKKKILVLAVMVVLLVATGVLNWVLTTRQNTGNLDPGATVETFFAAYRNERTTSRAESMLYLDAIIASDTSSEEAKAAAEAQKLELINRIEKELIIEGLIKAKGYNEVIVTLSDNSVNVVVAAENLGLSDAAKITDIVVTETGSRNVKIIPYN